MNDYKGNQLRVAAYIRVSTSNFDQLNSFDNQYKYFNDSIKKHPDWLLVNIYRDEGITGTNTSKRTGFKEMIEDAYNGKIDLILTKEVSRFARNTVDSLQYVRKLKDKGVYVIFLLDNIDTRDPDSEFRLTFMAALAQEESHKTSERVKWGIRHQMEKGFIFGGDFLGYKCIKGELFIVEEEAKVVRLIFYKYTIEKKGVYTIIKELENEGISPYSPTYHYKLKYNNKWNPDKIRRILRNEKYVGDLAQQKRWTPNYLSHHVQPNRGELEIIYIKDHHPDKAIINRDLWDKTQEELKRRSNKTSSIKYSNKYWCSNKIKCGECGLSYSSSTKILKSGSKIVYWRCSDSSLPTTVLRKKCTNIMIRSSSLKDIVIYIMRFLEANTSTLQEEIISEIKNLKTDDNINYKSVIIDKIKAIEKKKLNLVEMKLSNEIDADEFYIMRNKLDKELSDLKNEDKKLENSLSHTKQTLEDTEKIIKKIKDVLSFKEESDDLLSEILEYAIVYKNKVLEVKLNFLPYIFKVSYKTTGKDISYRTEILAIEHKAIL